MKSILILLLVGLLSSCIGDVGVSGYSFTRTYSCKCPTGYEVNPAQDGCTKQSYQDFVQDMNAKQVLLGDNFSGYGQSQFFEEGQESDKWPYRFDPVAKGKNAQGEDLIGEKLETPSVFWHERIVGPNRVSVKSREQYIWHAKTVCINLDQEKSYSLLIGGDNFWRIKIDGIPFASCDQSEWCWRDLRFVSQTLKSGKHLVELKYYDAGYDGALWYEVFDQSLESLKTASSESDLNIKFSSASLIGQTWDYSGEVCPEGYSYDACSPDKKCVKLEKAKCMPQ
jgi:hypothetical protein